MWGKEWNVICNMWPPGYAFTAAAGETSSHKLGGRTSAGVLLKSGGVQLGVSEESTGILE